MFILTRSFFGPVDMTLEITLERYHQIHCFLTAVFYNALMMSPNALNHSQVMAVEYLL